MLNEKFNKNIIADAMRVLSGQTTEKKPLPQSLKDAAVAAASSLRLLNEGVVSIESRRDTLRKHLNEGVKGCGCTPTTEMITRFEEEVEERLKEATKPLATPAAAVKQTKTPPVDAKKMPENTGLRGTKQPPKNIGEEIETGLREFVSALTEEEIEILGGILEAKMGKKQLEKAVNDAYKKYFDRVQVSMMELPKIYKAIEAAIVGGSDLDKVMSDLVKKYRA